MTLTIGLMRHFQTDWNALHRLQGRTDRPLMEDARTRLKELMLPSPWSDARLIATPLSRAQDTAQLLTGRTPEIIAGLTELSWGDWEGKRGADLIADPTSGYKHVEDWGWDMAPPNGESPGDAWARIGPALAQIAADDTPALLVVHRGVMRVIMAKAYNWNFNSVEPFKIKRERIYPIHLNPDGEPIGYGEAVRLEERTA